MDFDENTTMQYFAVRALTILPLELVRASDIVIALLRAVLCGRSITRRERRAAPCEMYTMEYPCGADHGKNYANAALLLTIGVCFSVISPLIPVIACVYFTIAIIVYRHQFLYVYTHEQESGGSMWPLVFRAVSVALVLFQLTMMGIFALNFAASEFTCIVPLMVLTVAFLVYCDTAYGQASRYLPLADAAELDIMGLRVSLLCYVMLCVYVTSSYVRYVMYVMHVMLCMFCCVCYVTYVMLRYVCYVNLRMLCMLCFVLHVMYVMLCLDNWLWSLVIVRLALCLSTHH
jgi:hypothetical protein